MTQLMGAGRSSAASAPSNLALIKYWGKRPRATQTPLNSSVSLTLDAFRTETNIQTFHSRGGPTAEHVFELKGADGSILESSLGPKSRRWLDLVLREIFEQTDLKLEPGVLLKIQSQNQFPTAAGIASSASGYAAWTLALSRLFELDRLLSVPDLQAMCARWARLGSGSALRSTWLGERDTQNQFVAWQLHPSGLESSIRHIQHAPLWERLKHRVVLIDSSPKQISSSEGHGHARTSLFQRIRESQAEQDYADIVVALEQGDFEKAAVLTERDALHMHAIMATGTPAQPYLSDQSSRAIAMFLEERNRRQWPAFWTLDAGPNPHILYLNSIEHEVSSWLDALPFRLGIKALAPPLKKRHEGRASGKMILLGEHSAVFGFPALAIPLPCLELRITGSRALEQTNSERWTVRIQGYRVALTSEEQVRLNEAWQLACQLAGTDREGLNHFAIDSDIPLSAGLGGSAALSVSLVRLALSLLDSKVERPQRTAIAALANQVEQLFHGVASGLDTAACDADSPIRFSRSTGPLPLHLKGPSAWVVLIDSRERSSTRVQVERVAQLRLEQPTETEDYLATLGHLAESGVSLLEQCQWKELGASLNGAQLALAGLGVSTLAIDRICVALRSHGALGAKLTGAGGGGMVLALFEHLPPLEAIAKTLGIATQEIHVFCLGE